MLERKEVLESQERFEQERYERFLIQERQDRLERREKYENQNQERLTQEKRPVDKDTRSPFRSPKKSPLLTSSSNTNYAYPSTEVKLEQLEVRNSLTRERYDSPAREKINRSPGLSKEVKDEVKTGYSPSREIKDKVSQNRDIRDKSYHSLNQVIKKESKQTDDKNYHSPSHQTKESTKVNQNKPKTHYNRDNQNNKEFQNNRNNPEIREIQSTKEIRKSPYQSPAHKTSSPSIHPNYSNLYLDQKAITKTHSQPKSIDNITYNPRSPTKFKSHKNRHRYSLW